MPSFCPLKLKKSSRVLVHLVAVFQCNALYWVKLCLMDIFSLLGGMPLKSSFHLTLVGSLASLHHLGLTWVTLVGKLASLHHVSKSSLSQVAKHHNLSGFHDSLYTINKNFNQYPYLYICTDQIPKYIWKCPTHGQEKLLSPQSISEPEKYYVLCWLLLCILSATLVLLVFPQVSQEWESPSKCLLSMWSFMWDLVSSL